MSNEIKMLIGISVVTLVLVVGAAFMFGGTSSSAKNTKPAKNVSELVHNDSHIIKGQSNKITIVEFGDFQCPACGAAYPTVTEVLKNYKSKVNFVFRNFPLPMHKNSQPAAEAAEAAGAQGKFFEMYDMLYTNQSKWGETNNAMDYFIQYAKALKLDVDKFTSDVQNKKYAKKIQKDIDDGYAVEVNSTPTFFINGVMQQPGMSYNDFKNAIDQALKS